MAYKNRVELIGNLTKTPELKTFGANKTPYLQLSLAVNKSYKEKGSNEWKKTTTFVNTVAYRFDAEALAKKNLQVGDTIELEGEISIKPGKSKEERPEMGIVTRKVQVLRKAQEKAQVQGKAPEKSESSKPAPAVNKAPAPAQEAAMDEDIPF
jgi:single stranded DNA-binding protein